jgi:hypothetical protein
MGKGPVLKYSYPVLSKYFNSMVVSGFLLCALASGNDEVTMEAPSLSQNIPRVVSPNLQLSLRVDGAFSEGGAVDQGFSIPSIRLSGFGQIGKYTEYRLSLGETREFSTSNLPQILPVEAFVNFCPGGFATQKSRSLQFKMGLFSPSFNPVWTPDLTDLNIPDFNQTHRALFLSREAGAELLYQPLDQSLEMGIGAFNGTGVFAQNTNNSRAFTAYLKWNWVVSDWKFSIGTGNYILKQANTDSVNYKSSWVSDGFLIVESPTRTSLFVVDAFSSEFQDSVRSIAPKGGSAILSSRINSWLGVFGRYEYSTQSPVLSGYVRQYQFGPEIYFEEYAKAFITFSQIESGGSTDRALAVRFRLSV